jgi:hypothetical protein
VWCGGYGGLVLSLVLLLRVLVLIVRVLLGHPLASDPILLLDLLSYLLLCPYALLVDLCGLLWGQPELGGCRFRVYGRWWCGSGARDHGALLCRLVSLLHFRLLCSLSVLPFSSLSTFSRLSHFSSPSPLFSFPPFDLVL